MKRLLLLVLIIALPCVVFAQHNDRTNTAIVNEDIITLLDIYRRDISSRPIIENAVFTIIEMDKYPYTEIVRFLGYTSNQTAIGKYLVGIKQKKELSIIKSIESMTAEQLMNYVVDNPTHKSFVASYITDIVAANLDSLNYYELCYLEESLPLVNPRLVEDEKLKRKDELLVIVKGNINELCKYEKQAIEQLCYKLERRALEYLYNGYNVVASSYSQIMFVPENPADAVSQYKTIINGCLHSKDLQHEMQNEANKYCEIINATREDFLNYTEKVEYPQLRLVIPSIGFNYSASSSHFNSLQEVRRSANNSRSNSGWVSSAVKMLGGEFWGMLVDAGRETFDESKNEKLATTEYECRRNYMMEVYNSLERNIGKQNKSITNGIRKELEKNQKEFIKYVQK